MVKLLCACSMFLVLPGYLLEGISSFSTVSPTPCTNPYTPAFTAANCVCFNGGVFNGNRCICPSGYVGLYCEQEVNSKCIYLHTNIVCMHISCVNALA